MIAAAILALSLMDNSAPTPATATDTGVTIVSDRIAFSNGLTWVGIEGKTTSGETVIYFIAGKPHATQIIPDFGQVCDFTYHLSTTEPPPPLGKPGETNKIIDSFACK